MAGSVTIAASLTGLPQGTLSFPPLTIVPSANNELATTVVSLASGANTITVPTGFTPSGVVMIPPSTNTQSLTLKGVTGDTGIAVSPNEPSLLNFASSPPSTFVVTAGGTISAGTSFVFF